MRPITDPTARIFIFLLLWAGIFFHGPGFCEETGENLDFLLPGPDTPLHQQYLGLSTDAPFSLGQIRARVVIVEIFSMYCPVCQREAGNINALFRLIQSNPALKDKVKLIGIGAGNSAFEVDFFRKTYNIEFPLFSDTDFSIHKKIGEVRTPHFFGLSLTEGGGFSVFFTGTGDPSTPETFLQSLLKASGINEN
nr:TlpA family protein disulfide reductase [Desulfobacula sp.]